MRKRLNDRIVQEMQIQSTMSCELIYVKDHYH